MSAELTRPLVVAFLEGLPAIVYFKDREGRFLAVSSWFVNHIGVASPKDLIGKTDFDLFNAHAPEARADEERVMRTGEALLDKLEREDRPDGRVSWVLTSKMPLRDATGNIVGTFGVSRDVTAQHETQASLAEAQRELSNASRLAGMAEVATGVLHNVGNVLNSLNVSAAVLTSAVRQSRATGLARVAQLLQEHAHDVAGFVTADPKGKLIPGFVASLAQHLSEERLQLLNEIESLRTNVEHISDIVSTQQAYATTAGVVEPIAPGSVIDDSLRMNGMSLARGDITVVKDYAECSPVWGERGKVLQILINLIRNAKHALEERPRGAGDAPRALTLKVEARGPDRVALIVSDNGIGIPPENLTRIFGHGFTTKAGGHGFGLHSSAIAAKQMGGTLNAASGGPNCGATFTLELPTTAAATEQAA